MEKTIISTPEAPMAIGAYSQGINLNGVCYFSGQLGISPESGELSQGLHSQIEQILKNIDALLKSQKLRRQDVIKTTVFLTDLNDFAQINEAYQGYFSEPYPARSCVEVSALPKKALVEIEVIASSAD